MKRAVIFNVKRMAVHDGPGIRTTLFLKGCPLHCRWCHNPEGIAPHPELGIFQHKCVECGRCQAVCDCHKVSAGTHELDRARCLACGKCVSACFTEALMLYGRSVTPGEILSELLDDVLFFETSGGGVTLSGGEPLLHADFCAELLKLLKENNAHTAVDTCGEVAWETFEKVLPYNDLFLYDFKHPDCEAHRALTGVGNERIKNNLRRLGHLQRPVEIRIPLIPEMNDAPDVLKRAAEFLAGIASVTAVRLLEYHDLSRSKYTAVGRVCSMPESLQLNPGMMQNAAEIFRSFNLKTILPDD